MSLVLDLKPALSMEQLDKRILRDFEENKNKQFKNSLDALLPAKLVSVIVALSGIEPEKQINEVTRQEREGLCYLLKQLTMTVTGTRGFNEAIITQGGQSVHHGVKTGQGTVFCRRGAGSGCSDRRL